MKNKALMNNRGLPRKKRCILIRSKIADNASLMRLTVYKSSKHISAQIFTSNGANVIASASSLEKDLRSTDFGKGKLKLSKEVGRIAAERAKLKGINQVAFDRSGYKYHGRIKAVAEGAKAAGLKF